MALALDAATPAFVSAAADTVPSASFTPPPGSVIVAVAWHDTAGGNTTNTSVITDSQGLTWTILRTRNRADAGGQNGHLQVSWAVVSSSLAMTVTTTGTNTGGFASLKPLVFTGVDTLNPFDVSDEGSNAGNVISMTLNTITDGTWAWIANIDWNAGAIPTPGTGITTDVGARPGGPNYTAWLANRDSVTSPAGAVTINSTAPSTGNTNNFIAFAVKPAAGAGTNPAGFDSAALSETSGVAVVSDGVDSGALAELAGVAAVSVSADTAAFSEAAALLVTADTSDAAAFSESAVQVPGVLSLSASETFVFAEIPANPNPSAGKGMSTLTYHLNRLAGTLVGGVPSQTAVEAANRWAGTSKLSLEDALNEKTGASVPALDVAGCLNLLAGTSRLTPVDAISRIP